MWTYCLGWNPFFIACYLPHIYLYTSKKLLNPNGINRLLTPCCVFFLNWSQPSPLYLRNSRKVFSTLRKTKRNVHRTIYFMWSTKFKRTCFPDDTLLMDGIFIFMASLAHKHCLLRSFPCMSLPGGKVSFAYAHGKKTFFFWQTSYFAYLASKL